MGWGEGGVTSAKEAQEKVEEEKEEKVTSKKEVLSFSSVLECPSRCSGTALVSKKCVAAKRLERGARSSLFVKLARVAPIIRGPSSRPPLIKTAFGQKKKSDVVRVQIVFCNGFFFFVHQQHVLALLLLKGSSLTLLVTELVLCLGCSRC